MTDEWDDFKAADLIGKHVLVGISYLDAAGKLIEQRQLHGSVVRANRKEGVVLALASSGEEFKLPPSTDTFEPAEPGEYRLRSTGEIVADPDYTCTWSVKSPLLTDEASLTNLSKLNGNCRLTTKGRNKR